MIEVVGLRPKYGHIQWMMAVSIKKPRDQIGM